MAVQGRVGFNGRPEEESRRQARLCIRNMCTLANNFSDSGIAPVIEHVIDDRPTLDLMLGLLTPRPVMFVVLAPPLETCRRRNATRPLEHRVHYGITPYYRATTIGRCASGWTEWAGGWTPLPRPRRRPPPPSPPRPREGQSSRARACVQSQSPRPERGPAPGSARESDQEGRAPLAPLHDTSTDPTDALLAAYDAQTRGVFPNPSAGVRHEHDGPLLRVMGPTRVLLVGPRDLGLRGAALAELIARQRGLAAARGTAVEWRTHQHDTPADLPGRLRSAGFVAGEEQPVLVGRAADLADPAAPVSLPEGVVLRQVTDDDTMHRIAVMEATVWGGEWSWLAHHLIARHAAAPAETAVLTAEADGEIVCAAWLVLRPGTHFAGLRGGSTLPAWRGLGLYRALLAARARLAVARGVKYLQADASADSDPILRRLGLHAVTTTTPYVRMPPEAE